MLIEWLSVFPVSCRNIAFVPDSNLFGSHSLKRMGQRKTNKNCRFTGTWYWSNNFVMRRMTVESLLTMVGCMAFLHLSNTLRRSLTITSRWRKFAKLFLDIPLLALVCLKVSGTSNEPGGRGAPFRRDFQVIFHVALYPSKSTSRYCYLL